MDSGKDSGTASGAQMIELFVAQFRTEVPRLLEVYGRRPTIREVAFVFSVPVDVVKALWRDALASCSDEIESILNGTADETNI